MKKIAIHQSQYIPWAPYLKKIAQADIFVVMDSVQFQKNGVQNRNKIRNKDGDFWLTVPVTGTLSDRIMEKRISSDSWRQKHWKSIKAAYSRAPRWNDYCMDLESLFNDSYFNLGEVNNKFLDFFLKTFEINTKIVNLSSLDVEGHKSELVLNICKEMGADCYLSGIGAKSYLYEDQFWDSGIEIKYMESKPPEYTQFHGEFIAGLSMLDMMMNCEKEDIVSYFTAT